MSFIFGLIAGLVVGAVSARFYMKSKLNRAVEVISEAEMKIEELQNRLDEFHSIIEQLQKKQESNGVNSKRTMWD